ncbi:hypothetical protein CY35_07G037900 [Sphagnum magellanicum]|uniref:Uncharacterized protein n=1 Tax=Sphagnum magellanicum TaxID=128215 RepID=A0ACB8HK92_9BRYO|nr:hypothetical protein CY35_07G037900 [Sphagnum magellanicum]
MANHPANAAAAIPAAAHVVGNAFVNQYYNVLHQSPQVVHRFYTDASLFTRAEAGPDGAVDTVMTQDEIHKKVMSLDYGDFKAEIKTVDSQDSLMGGVLVMVSGSLSCKSTGNRNFTQSFFLAPQEKGYFVLNDIFRYLDEAPPPVSKPAPSLPNGVPELPLAPEPAIEGHVVVEMESREVVSPPSIDSEVGVEEKVDITEQEALEVQDNEPAEDIAQVDILSPNNEEPASPPVQSYSSPSPPSHPLEEDSTSTGEKPKVSYASILRLRNAGGSAAPAFHSAPKAAQPAPEASAAPTVSSSSPASGDTHNTLDENAPHEAEADGHSVYIKNLPINIMPAEVEEQFAQFGPIKPGGVNVRSQKASPVSIGGRPAYVEEKRPMGSRVPRQRTQEGRNERPYRSDGIRGRGSYSGRSLGRGSGQERDRDMSNRGRAPGAPRGGFQGANVVGGASNSNGINSGADANRRADGQGGNAAGLRPSRRGAGNQLPRNGSGSFPRNSPSTPTAV